MRNLQLGCAAFLVLAAAYAPQALAFETQYGEGATANGGVQYSDPDEQLDAMADGASGGSGSLFIYNFGGAASGNQPTAAVPDQSVHWSADRIRTVFGPDAHY
jgi:hypothetical protein